MRLDIFKKGKDLIGKTIGIAGEHLTGSEMADALTKALGQQIKYNAVPPDVFRSFGFPGADDLGNMFQYKHDFNDDYFGFRNIEKTRSLNPQLKTFKQWLDIKKDLIPLE